MSRSTTQRLLKRKEFMAAVKQSCATSLGAPDTMHARSTMNLLKIHFNPNYRIHFEVMIAADKGLIELGLHIEDGPESTARLLEYFDERVVEVKHELGPEIELERWTRSWGHFVEVCAVQPLTPEFATGIGKRLAAIITVLQPILDEAISDGVASATPRPGTGRRRFRR